MAKVAKLVYVSMVTRVIVEEGATEDQILDIAQYKFMDKVQTELYENIENIVDDVECPYDPAVDK